MKLTLVGSGNVALVLSKLLVAAGHSVDEITGRNTEAVSFISRLVGAKVKFNFSDLGGNTDVIILAVSDAAIEEVANQMNHTESLVVHTSGATSIEMLRRFKRYGVLYPLQSLRKEMNQLPPVPFFVDANSGSDIELLLHLVSSTHNKASIANDKERLRYHIAAVFASNFTNHLYAVTQAFCDAEQIHFENLWPLIEETAHRLKNHRAAQMQTGPAIRHDEITLQNHLHLLQAYPDYADVYRFITDSIQQLNDKLK